MRKLLIFDEQTEYVEGRHLTGVTRTSSSKHSSVSDMYANQLSIPVSQMPLLLRPCAGNLPAHDAVLRIMPLNPWKGCLCSGLA